MQVNSGTLTLLYHQKRDGNSTYENYKWRSEEFVIVHNRHWKVNFEIENN